MNPAPVCYAQPRKRRSRDILTQFAAGSGGRVHNETVAKLEDGPAAFFGVVGIEHLLNEARDGGREWYYLDNSYFDSTRKTMTRVTRNALQDDGTGAPDWKRFDALGIEVKPWTHSGNHIVVCVQSDHFMREVVRWPGGMSGWSADVLGRLAIHTKRPIVMRLWNSDKEGLAATLQDDLRDAWALVAHSSAAAIGAILSGVPAFLTGRCAALTLGLSDLTRIEAPHRPDGRKRWAAALAARQFTRDELSDGTAWRTLCATAG